MPSNDAIRERIKSEYSYWVKWEPVRAAVDSAIVAAILAAVSLAMEDEEVGR